MLNLLFCMLSIFIITGFFGDAIALCIFGCLGNDIGMHVCGIILIAYAAFILGFLFYHLGDKCDKFKDEKEYYERRIQRLEEDTDQYQREIKSYKKLEKYSKKHFEYEQKQRELEAENETLRKIILTKDGIKDDIGDKYIELLINSKGATSE